MHSWLIGKALGAAQIKPELQQGPVQFGSWAQVPALFIWMDG